jgi:hypothetical protein
MALWGSSFPWIKGGSGGLTRITLNHSVITRNEPVWESNFRQQNKVTGVNVHTQRGYRWAFECTDYLFKYDDPMTQFMELTSLLGTLVNIFPHYDDVIPIQDEYGNDAEFIFISLKHGYVNRGSYPDIAEIAFESMCFVDMASNLIT